MNQEKKCATDVLRENTDNILRCLDQSLIRSHLYQLKVLTVDEYAHLCSLPSSTANEVLFIMITKKGVYGFQQFMIALQRTSENPGHLEILEALTVDLKHAESCSRSAANILHGLLPISRTTSLDHYPTTDTTD